MPSCRLGLHHDRPVSPWGQGTRSTGDSSTLGSGRAGQDRSCPALPIPASQPGAGQLGGAPRQPQTGGIGHLPGDGPRPGWDTSPWVGGTHGWGGLWAAGEHPCSGGTGAGADMGSWAVGRWGNAWGVGQGGCPPDPDKNWVFYFSIIN